MPWVTLCKQAQARAAGILPVEIQGVPLLVVWDGERFAVTEALCPHDHARLSEGRLERGCLVCPRHGARFDLSSGASQPGFRLRPLKLYACQLVGDELAIESTALKPRAKVTWDLSGKA